MDNRPKSSPQHSQDKQGGMTGQAKKEDKGDKEKQVWNTRKSTIKNREAIITHHWDTTADCVGGHFMHHSVGDSDIALAAHMCEAARLDRYAVKNKALLFFRLVFVTMLFFCNSLH